jgi:hypothetical protein
MPERVAELLADAPIEKDSVLASHVDLLHGLNLDQVVKET